MSVVEMEEFVFGGCGKREEIVKNEGEKGSGRS
jgi:hypothetical protein